MQIKKSKLIKCILLILTSKNNLIFKKNVKDIDFAAIKKIFD